MVWLYLGVAELLLQFRAIVEVGCSSFRGAEGDSLLYPLVLPGHFVYQGHDQLFLCFCLLRSYWYMFSSCFFRWKKVSGSGL